MSAEFGVVEAVEDLVHDVAKYMTFETRFLGPTASQSEWLRALRSDLCNTRKTTDGDGTVRVESAWSMWARLLPPQLVDHPAAAHVTDEMRLLERVDWDDPSLDVAAVASLARSASSGIRQLLLRVRDEFGGMDDG